MLFYQYELGVQGSLVLAVGNERGWDLVKLEIVFMKHYAPNH